MGRLKKREQKEDTLRDTEFCTECGEELSEFQFTDKEIKDVKDNFEQCKKTGKYKGEKCSKIYIIEDVDLPDDADEQ